MNDNRFNKNDNIKQNDNKLPENLTVEETICGVYSRIFQIDAGSC